MNDLTSDERQMVINLLLQYKGLTVSESATVIGVIQKIQAGMQEELPKKVEEDHPAGKSEKRST